jgi:hypothetical protein
MLDDGRVRDFLHFTKYNAGRRRNVAAEASFDLWTCGGGADRRAQGCFWRPDNCDAKRAAAVGCEVGRKRPPWHSVWPRSVLSSGMPRRTFRSATIG